MRITLVFCAGDPSALVIFPMTVSELLPEDACCDTGEQKTNSIASATQKANRDFVI
jgi:hypothetical protein